MPPTFAYIMALMAYVVLATLVWILSGLLALIPRTRLAGTKIALAMLFSFPGVLAWQIAGFPILFVIALGLGLLLQLHIQNDVVDTIGILLVVIILLGGSFAISVAGFADGWRVGWSFAKCKDLQSAIKLSLFYRGFNRLINAVKKSKA